MYKNRVTNGRIFFEIPSLLSYKARKSRAGKFKIICFRVTLNLGGKIVIGQDIKIHGMEHCTTTFQMPLPVH